MPSPTLCEQVCTESGWIGELLVVALFAGRALWVGRKNHQLLETNTKKTVELHQKVEQLSLRPPAMPAVPLSIKLAPEQLEGLAASVRASLPDPSLMRLSGRPSGPDDPERDE
jgi:hypothetical protein